MLLWFSAERCSSLGCGADFGEYVLLALVWGSLGAVAGGDLFLVWVRSGFRWRVPSRSGLDRLHSEDLLASVAAPVRGSGVV